MKIHMNRIWLKINITNSSFITVHIWDSENEQQLCRSFSDKLEGLKASFQLFFFAETISAEEFSFLIEKILFHAEIPETTAGQQDLQDYLLVINCLAEGKIINATQRVRFRNKIRNIQFQNKTP